MIKNNIVSILSSRSFLKLHKDLLCDLGVRQTVLLSALLDKADYFGRMIEGQRGSWDGWFFVSREDLFIDSRIPIESQKKIIDELKKKNVIETKLKGLPRKKHFRINDQGVSSSLSRGEKVRNKEIAHKRQNTSAINPKDQVYANGTNEVYVNPENTPILIRTNINNNQTNKNLSKDKLSAPRAHKLNSTTIEIINYWNEEALKYKNKKLVTKPSIHKVDLKNPTDVIIRTDNVIKCLLKNKLFQNNYKLKNKDIPKDKYNVDEIKNIISQYMKLFINGNSYKKGDITKTKLHKSIADFFYFPMVNLSYFVAVSANEVKGLSEIINEEQNDIHELDTELLERYEELFPVDYLNQYDSKIVTAINNIYTANQNIIKYGNPVHHREDGWVELDGCNDGFVDEHIKYLKSFKDVTYGHLKLSGKIFEIFNKKMKDQYKVDVDLLIKGEWREAYKGKIKRVKNKAGKFNIGNYWYELDLFASWEYLDLIREAFVEDLKAGKIKDGLIERKLKNDRVLDNLKKFGVEDVADYYDLCIPKDIDEDPFNGMNIL
ncbi:MAG: hypothetical protein GY679_02200 [Mycoplasma sp.]|nr:hypothetical protein [Mycoplasma sp.]